MTTRIVITNPLGNKDHVLVSVIDPIAKEGERIRRIVRLEVGESQAFYGYDGIEIHVKEVRATRNTHDNPKPPMCGRRQT